MEETKNVEPSVLVFIVTSDGAREVAVEAIRNNAVNYAARKKALPEPGTPDQPDTKSSAVTLGQYQKIMQAVRFIHDNYQRDIRLPAAAAEAGMSPAHFSRTFRKAMGLSYQEFVNTRRITKAKKLLRTSPLSIREIAGAVGFADTTGFGRIFKKLTGQTPSVYRGGRGK